MWLMRAFPVEFGSQSGIDDYCKRPQSCRPFEGTLDIRQVKTRQKAKMKKHYVGAAIKDLTENKT
jgi:hypothetical protein